MLRDLRMFDIDSRILCCVKGHFVALLLGTVAFVGCSGQDHENPEPSSSVAERCLVRLHGKGGSGAKTETLGLVTVISPTGNSGGWGGRQWLYFPESKYEEARATVSDAVASCNQVILNGFSNGGAFAAKLYCRGETFGGRLIGVVVDDPVTDAAVNDCDPDPDVRLTLYWTGALEGNAVPGWPCREHDWTCEGGVTQGIKSYTAQLKTDAVKSPFQDHSWFVDAPEATSWFR